MSWLLEHSTGLNLAISVAQFLLGIAIGFWAKPELLTKGKSGEWAFGFWTIQWLIFSLTYLVVIRYPTQEALLLVLVDIQSLLVLACAATLLLGEPLKLDRTLKILGILCFASVIYNFGFYPWHVDDPSWGQLLRWTLPSQTLSIFSLNFIGIVACLRYRSYAFPFLLAAVGYSACQQALYSATVLRFPNVSQALPEAAPWYLAVAIGKVLLGGMFYALSFLVLPSYPRLLSPGPPQVPGKVSNRLRTAAGWAISFFVIPLVFALLAEWLFSRFKN